ncbi:Pectinesterase inhibitor domain containing protein [Quillaja saponaria]|uniref:Pectinesterase inhibitor domain containing protein n=1 Tax=Quillaja saponaria TaxID=32244 RepID=A0AAD7Q3C3_QUISA|nr:Pectinesterase inhibitor domain containing protein [Quillaja saponaria]
MSPPSQTHALILSAISLSLLLLVNSPLPTTATSQLIESVCNQTSISSSKCVKLLESDPRSSSATNLHDLAKVVLEAAITNSTDSLSFINKMLKNNSTEPIKKCAFWYEAVVGSFNSALKELDEDIETANYDVKIAGDDANNCETSIASSGVKIPSISSRNDIIKLYSDILFVITNKLD